MVLICISKAQMQEKHLTAHVDYKHVLWSVCPLLLHHGKASAALDPYI